MAKLSKKALKMQATLDEKKAEETAKPETTETAKPEEQSAAAPTSPETPVAEKKRPDMPEAFCMAPIDPKVWESAEVFFDPTNPTCVTCAKKYVEAYSACEARHLILADKSKPAKAAGTGTRKPREAGAGSQTTIIDNLLKERKLVKEIGLALAPKFYNGDAKKGEGRTNRHIKSIKDGSYIKAAEMKPFITHLSA